MVRKKGIIQPVKPGLWKSIAKVGAKILHGEDDMSVEEYKLHNFSFRWVERLAAICPKNNVTSDRR